ncbi:hypothetical protein MRB53_000065 [Persea americana]|uniref:Uncharacterized protein n=1 Tax=Persea americana TaxID=3435 RepID=A0ACC2MQ82_PERAE|nr:hypothetical protein MRB53_000065 [Persea americana]
MERSFRGFSRGLVIFICILSPLIASVVENGGGHHDGGGEDHHEPNAAERAIGLTTPTGHWAKIKSWLNMGLINLRPPDADKTDKYPSGAGEVMKEVASTSLETTKKTAKRAAQVAEDVVHKTVEKVKTRVPHSGEETHDEI